MKRTVPWVVALGVLLLGGSGFAKTHAPSDFTREARVSLDASGKVIALAFVNKDAGDDPIGQRLDPVIRGWKFEPGTGNGTPMPTETTLFVELEASPSRSGGYAIRIVHAWTGVGRLSTPAPDFPMHERASGREAVMNLLVSVDASGIPSDVAVEKIATNGSQDRFEEAARNAAWQWRFQPEKVGGQPVAAKVRIPITFCVDPSFGGTSCAQFQEQVLETGKGMPANADETLDGRVRLVTPVAGTALQVPAPAG